MRGWLLLLLILMACGVEVPGPVPTAAAANHEVVLDVTNNRGEAVVVRVVPRLLAITGPPAPADVGQGEGSEIAGGDRRTLRLLMDTDHWTITVNGGALIRSDEHDFIPGGWTTGRLVIDPQEAFVELDRSEPAPTN